MSSTCLIDADSIYFKICCVMKNEKRREKSIRDMIDRKVVEILEHNFTDDYEMYVKGSGNYRKDLYKEYKSNRPPLDEALASALTYSIDYMADRHGAVKSDGMEADDMVAIRARDLREEKKPFTVVGIDKDLLQIPGDHYNFDKKTHRFITEDEGHKLLMLQCLTGDATDGIPGIHRVGPKTAEKFLDGISTKRQWSRVRATWRAKNAGEPYRAWSLLRMITSFDEMDIVSDVIEKGQSHRELYDRIKMLNETTI